MQLIDNVIPNFLVYYFLSPSLTGTPHTGRMHQIRVHLQYLGHPVMNDPLYTGPVWGPDQGKDGNIPFANNDEVRSLVHSINDRNYQFKC